MSGPHQNLPEGSSGNKTIEVEAEIEGRTPIIVTVRGGAQFVPDVLKAADLGDDALVFERDQEEPITIPKEGRKAIRIIVHRCRKILVEVRFEERIIHESFAPSAVVFRVLRWAVGKKGFNLDASAEGRAKLILPGADAPLQDDVQIGMLVSDKACKLIVDLTLKDFTNG